MYTSHFASMWHTVKHGRWLWLLAIVTLVLTSVYLTSNGAVWAAGSSENPDPPTHWPGPINAYKTASQWMVASGQVLTYTIHVRNTGMSQVAMQVVDPVPSHMNYVAGSANLGGVYDPGANTLAWTAVTATHDSEVAFSFAVTAAAVTTSTFVMNTATITTGLESLERS